MTFIEEFCPALLIPRYNYVVGAVFQKPSIQYKSIYNSRSSIISNHLLNCKFFIKNCKTGLKALLNGTNLVQGLTALAGYELHMRKLRPTGTPTSINEILKLFNILMRNPLEFLLNNYLLQAGEIEAFISFRYCIRNGEKAFPSLLL